jgi:ubiquinone biosynthesis protein COQ4
MKSIVQLSSMQTQTVTDFVKQSMIAIRDPTRADAVAAVGEMTGRHQLMQLVKTMQQHPVGQQILRDRPIVSKTTLPYDDLIEQAQLLQQQYGTVANIPIDELSFGAAYGLFLLKHGFDPDERDDIKYLSSTTEADIAYVMLRYRQCHDYWHVLTQLPPTVQGEIGLKLLELFHMNMPVAALSCLSQSAVILSNVSTGMLSQNDSNTSPHSTNVTTIDDLHTIWNMYLPWARHQARSMQIANVSLLNVYYENEFHVPLHILQRRLQIQPYQQI